MSIFVDEFIFLFSVNNKTSPTDCAVASAHICGGVAALRSRPLAAARFLPVHGKHREFPVVFLCSCRHKSKKRHCISDCREAGLSSPIWLQREAGVLSKEKALHTIVGQTHKTAPHKERCFLRTTQRFTTSYCCLRSGVTLFSTHTALCRAR